MAAQIARNLLWNIDVDKNLEFVKQNPHILSIPVTIADPHGQKVRGTILQIVAAAGDFNPRKLKEGETDYGLVERLRSCFSNPDEYKKQLNEWFREGHQEETAKRIAPYVEAVQTFCREIIDSKEIKNETPLNTLFNLPIVQKFKTAFTFFAKKDKMTKLTQQLADYPELKESIDLTAYKKLVEEAAKAEIINRQAADSQKTALYIALEEKQFERAVILLKHNADAFIPTKNNDTAFELVARIMSSVSEPSKQLREIVYMISNQNYAKKSMKSKTV